MLFPVFSPFASVQAEDPGTFYFIQVTDTHFGTPLSLDRMPILIDSINRLPFKIDFAVLTGDIFDKRLDNEDANQALNILKKLNTPLLVIAGNHDLSSYDAGFFKEKFGKLNYFLVHKGYCLAFISSIHPQNNAMEDVVSQFEKQLAGNKFPLLLFHHEPFIEQCYNAAALKTWEDLVTHHHCAAIVSGHFHRDGLNWFGGIPEYISSCVAKFNGRQASYRLYKCENRRLSYATFYIRDPYEEKSGSYH